MITTTTEHLKQLLDHAAESGAMKMAILLGQYPATVNQSKAFKLYGRENILRWTKEGLIEQIQDGDNANIRYDVMKLEAVAKASNRHTYLTKEER